MSQSLHGTHHLAESRRLFTAQQLTPQISDTKKPDR